MKLLISMMLLISVLNVIGQESSKRIGVSYYQVTLIVFESEIDGFNVGLPESIDLGQDGKRIKLQATDNQWEQSNLVIWTVDGNYYTFDLFYEDKLDSYLHIIKVDVSSYKGESSGDISREDTSDPFTAGGYSLDRGTLANLKLNCTKLKDLKGRYSFLGDERRKVDLYLDGLFVDEEYFYLKVTLENRTEVVYNVEIVSFTIKAKEKKGISATSSTPEIQNIIYAYEDGFGTIGAKTEVSTVYIIEKFALDQDSQLLIDIFEMNGSRERGLAIQEKDIRQAKGLSDVIN